MNVLQEGIKPFSNGDITLSMYNNSTNDFDTQCDVDISRSNHNSRNENMCIDDSEEARPSEYFPFINVMSDVVICNPCHMEGADLQEKIQKHKKTNSRGFSSLQKRIEEVKNDINNLTHKLNPGQSHEFDVNSAYNTNGCSNIDDYIMSEDDNIQMIEEETSSDEENGNSNKIGKYVSRYKPKNPYSDLSENTQKILEKLYLKKTDNVNRTSTNHDDIQIEMEEDDIEFTFTIRPNSLINDIMSRDPLPVIEEEQESNESSEESDDETSIVYDCQSVPGVDMIPPKSCSMHSFDVTESDSYKTPGSNSYLHWEQKGLNDETDEYYSDVANRLGSHGSSTESIVSQEFDQNGQIDDVVTNNEEFDFEIKPFENKSSDMMQAEERFTSDAEYDNTFWSSEDLLQSTEQSDSLYERTHHSIVKSSLPDLSGRSNQLEFTIPHRSLIPQTFTISTDLDELFEQLPPYCESSTGRLSQSLINLGTIRPHKPTAQNEDILQQRISTDNLLETDLDSGYVSIYRPVTESEILPKVKFSSSMGNVCPNKSTSPLINKLRSMAGSVSELRIAESLTKLNIPVWLNFNTKNADNGIQSCKDDSKRNSSSTPSSRSSIDRTPSSTKRDVTRQRHLIESSVVPVIKPTASTPVVLPSQVLRQNSQRKLMPITVCQARQLLLPNKMTLNSITNPSIKAK